MFSKVLIFAAVAAVARAGVLAPGLASPIGLASPGLGLGLASPLGYTRTLATPTLGLSGSLGLAAPGLGLGLTRTLASPTLGLARTIAAPAIAQVAVPAEYDANPQYSYSYAVADALTGDNKGQTETRNGDVVQGSYNLVESDGTRRIVDYTADPINGFNAIVRKEGLAVQKTVVAAPAIASPILGARTIGSPLLGASIASPLALGARTIGLGASIASPLALGARTYGSPLIGSSIGSSILGARTIGLGASIASPLALGARAYGNPLLGAASINGAYLG